MVLATTTGLIKSLVSGILIERKLIKLVFFKVPEEAYLRLRNRKLIQYSLTSERAL